ncbi:unnamed protein product [Phytophthora fragariaefolia]|uniref:Unnamed protein product n=1 Tax=Phytophthora fragariaefolia TaxID=1490495 RepID=A0A9W6WWU7_9STRA|nr:unnamed protein product [Phytophthora fragariaefolia]
MAAGFCVPLAGYTPSSAAPNQNQTSFRNLLASAHASPSVKLTDAVTPGSCHATWNRCAVTATLFQPPPRPSTTAYRCVLKLGVGLVVSTVADQAAIEPAVPIAARGALNLTHQR